jgi:hypothetical protein
MNIEEEWPKGQTKYAHKAKDRVTQTALKTGGKQFLLK